MPQSDDFAPPFGLANGFDGVLDWLQGATRGEQQGLDLDLGWPG